MLPVVVFPRFCRAAAVVCIVRGMECVVQEEVLAQLVQMLLLAVQSVQALECNLKNTHQHVTFYFGQMHILFACKIQMLLDLPLKMSCQKWI